MENKELLHCPFCGYEPKYRFVGTTDNLAKATISCQCGAMCGWHDTKSAAIEAWNSRVLPKLQELPEGLVKEIGIAIVKEAWAIEGLPVKALIMGQKLLGRAALSVAAPYYEKQIAELKHTIEVKDTHINMGEHTVGNLCTEIEELKAQIPQWLPISKAPKNGSRFLGNAPDLEAEVSIFFINKGNFYSAWNGNKIGDHAIKPTKWMPLPKPPAQ